MTVPGMGGIAPMPPGYVPPGLPDTAAGSTNVFRGRLVIVFGPVGTVSGIFVYTPGTTPAPGNPPIISLTESSTDPYGNAVNGGVVVGTSAHPQVQLQSVGGIGKLTFLLNNAGYSDAFIDGGFASGIGVISIQGPASTVAASDDFISHVISAADGVAGHFANEEWAYTDTAAAFHTYAFVDGTGFNATAVSQLTAADPNVAPTPAAPAFGETWHDMRPLLNSFVGTIAGRYPPQYRKTADGTIEVEGYIRLPAAYNGVTFATLPAAYRPGSNSGWKGPCFCETNPTANLGSPNVQIDTGGNLQLHNLGTGLVGTIVSISMRYPLNNTGTINS
jgi:hypothetical protein